MSLCKKCGKELTGHQLSYCSAYCSKLHLASLYRKRHRERIRIYNREYAKKGVRGNPSTSKIIAEFKVRNPLCAKCGTDKNIQIGHIKPRHCNGGNRDNLITLCGKHHRQFDELLREFWEGTSIAKDKKLGMTAMQALVKEARRWGIKYIRVDRIEQLPGVTSKPGTLPGTTPVAKTFRDQYFHY